MWHGMGDLEAHEDMQHGKPAYWIAAGVIAAIWLLLASLAVWGTVLLFR
jgi:hypothetical protein